jgi:hypothetical protein
MGPVTLTIQDRIKYYVRFRGMGQEEAVEQVESELGMKLPESILERL